MIGVGINEREAKKNCIRLSKENKGKYVYAFASFGLYASISKTLNVHACSDSTFNWYVLNGKVKNFTEAQIIADQKATPILH